MLPVGDIDDVLRVFETLLPVEGSIAAGRDEATGSVGVDGADGSDPAVPTVPDQRRAALRDALIGEGDGYVGAGAKAAALLWFGTRRACLLYTSRCV